MSPQVQLLTEPGHMEQVWRLRFAVSSYLVDLDRCFPDGRWVEPLDAGALQFGVVIDDQVVAAARLSIHESSANFPIAAMFHGAGSTLAERFGWFSRLVVHTDWQRQGLSGALDQARFAHAEAIGLDDLCLMVHHWFRLDALQRLGFRRLDWDGRGARPPLICATDVPMIWCREVAA